MNPLDDCQLHPDVGSISFQYVHPCPDGSLERRCFCMKVGDNPDFWLAERLMPGAEKGGCLVGVIVGDEDEDQSFQVFLRVRGSCFETRIYADSPEELAAALMSIGGLQTTWLGSPELTWSEKVKLVLRWYWERRPVLRRRSPLAIFD